MSRWLSPLMAFCLSFMLMTTLAPVVGVTVDRQIDFWALWLGTVLLLALPITYLEFALARRAKTTALNALMTLTREADASARWRLVGWLAVGFIPFLAGAMLSNAQHTAMQFLELPFTETIGMLVLAAFAVILSFIPRVFLIILSVVGTLASLILCHMFKLQLETWHVTALTLGEWGSATVLTLVASGLGLGIYAQTSVKTESATLGVMPILVAQVCAVLAFGFFAVQTEVPAISVLITVIFAAGLLLQLARQQLKERHSSIAIQYAFLLFPLLIWVVSMLLPVLNMVAMFWGLLICLVYAIFAGWIMKISHLRKALNFSSEMIYNLWRIAVRLVLPLSIIIAMIGVVVK